MADPIAPPSPDASADEIANYLIEVGDVEAAKWLTRNVSRLDARTRDLVDERLQLQSSLSVSTGADGPGEGFVQSLAAIKNVNDDRAAEVETERRVEAARAAATASAEAAGATAAEAAAAADAAENGVLTDRGVARLEPQIIVDTYGKPPTPEQQKELVASWNELNPDAPISNYGQLVDAINENPSDPNVSDVVGLAATGLEPTRMYQWDISVPGVNYAPGMVTNPGTTKLTMTDREFETFKSLYGAGFSTADVKKLGQLAAQLGIGEAFGGVNSETGGAGWQILAAGAAALGMWNLAEREDKANNAVPVTSRSASLNGATVTSSTIRGQQAISRNEMTRLRNWGVQYMQGMKMYGQNDTIAFLHAMNAPLATRIASTPIDKVSLTDRRQAMSFIQMAGFSPEAMQGLGFGYIGGLQDLPANQSAAGRSGPVRQMPDPDAVRQSAKDMYRTLFAAEPTDAQLAQLVGSVTSAISSADIDGEDGVVQDVNTQAQIRKRLQEMPEYGDLYGKKPGGMSEEEYQAQFRNGAGVILGNAAPRPDVIRAGMRSGNYNTSVGAAATTREAWEGSTFMGRLARAAQITSENT
jgi:hypothetical protein